MMDFTVRPGTEEDIPAVLRLWREMMDHHARLEPRFEPLPSPAGEDAWEKHLREDIWGKQDWHIVVAEADGQVVGMMIGTLRDPYPVFKPERYGFVADAVVSSAARRSGVGRALFEALKAWFRQQRVSHLELVVAHANPASQAFWRAMGCTDFMDNMWYDLEAK
jgi:ribosomal protein S18 acetylase RimI-like enzyme